MEIKKMNPGSYYGGGEDTSTYGREFDESQFNNGNNKDK